MDFREVLERSRARRIEEAVDPYLEAAVECGRTRNRTWIADAGGFPGWRLAGNVYSSRSLLAEVLSTSVEGVTDIMLEASENPSPVKVVDLPSYYHEVRTDSIPVPTYFAGDGGPYFTSGIFHSGIDDLKNVSFHRMMHLGENRFAVRVVPRHLRSLMAKARERGEELHAVVSVGADPFSLLAGSTSMPFGQDELEVASSLRMAAEGKPLEVHTLGPQGLMAPSGTELIMEGHFTDELVPEGPFVDITSTYDRAGMDPGEPVFVVDRALAREDPLMHVLLPGGFEHYLMMGIPKEPAIKKAVSMVVPRVHAVRLTEGGCCWMHGIISVTQQKQGDAKNAIMAAFSGHPSMKRVIAVDPDIDIFSDHEVEWALATRYQARRDTIILDGARGSTLDPSSERSDGTTSKEGLDATMPMGREEEFKRVDGTTEKLNS